MSFIEYSIPEADAGQRLERWIKKHYKLIPYGVLQKWFRQGSIQIDLKKVKGNFVIPGACTLRMPEFLFDQPVSQKPSLKPETLELLKSAIVFQDDQILLLDKPHGLATQGGSQQRDYLDLYIKDLCPDNPEPLRLVHRLDKETSGLIVLAKTYQAAKELSQAFKVRTIEKTYLAVVVGKPERSQGIIMDPLIKHVHGSNSKMCLGDDNQGLPATTGYRILKLLSNNLTLLELRPETGRMHQLRVHCAKSLGCPILGDGLYGGGQAHPFNKRTRLYLHSAILQFKESVLAKRYQKPFIAFPTWYSAAIEDRFSI